MNPVEIDNASNTVSAMLTGTQLDRISFLGVVIELSFSSRIAPPEAWSYDSDEFPNNLAREIKVTINTDAWTNVLVGPPTYRHQRYEFEDRIVIVSALCRTIGERVTFAAVNQAGNLEFTLGGNHFFTETELELRSWGEVLWEVESDENQQGKADWHVSLSDDLDLFVRAPTSPISL